jgi:hypothetical protein
MVGQNLWAVNRRTKSTPTAFVKKENQQTKKPTDQPTNQPTDQPTNRPPTGQPTNQPTNHSDHSEPSERTMDMESG